MRRRLKTYWAVIAQPHKEGYTINQLGWLFTAREIVEIATRRGCSVDETYIEEGAIIARVRVYADEVFYLFGQRMVPDCNSFRKVYLDTRGEWRYRWIRARYKQWKELLKLSASQLNTMRL